MTRYAYAYEKLLGAVEIMATGRGSRPERLARATHRHLFKIRHQKANRLPDELAAQYDAAASLTEPSSPAGLGWG